VLAPGESGIAPVWRVESSHYRGGGHDNDFLPLLIYDHERFYVSSYRAGLKLGPGEIFIKRRFEGFASTEVPPSMAGTEVRHPGADVGIALKHRLGAGVAYGELLTDASGHSDGSELRLGYRYERWWEGRLRLRPYATLAWRDAKLNDFYYGVPGYEAGAGLDLELGVTATYRLNPAWQILGGVELKRVSSAIAGSPAVEDRLWPSLTLGLMYNFTPQSAPPGGRKPLIVRVLKGASSDCDMLQIVSLQCFSTHTQDPTDVFAVEVGQKLYERINGWNLDMAGFVGLLQHQDKGLQPDAWQLQTYFKLYWYGFPWRERVMTRLAYGTGIAYASRVPYSEQRDQALRGRDTSKLLLYADPTIDVSVGDLFGARSLRETFVGLGVSHRSGVFGASKLFNNVDGGSNYIYGYVETSF
jgi:outer membrane protein